jgi:hypothetical protein
VCTGGMTAAGPVYLADPQVLDASQAPGFEECICTLGSIILHVTCEATDDGHYT